MSAPVWLCNMHRNPSAERGYRAVGDVEYTGRAVKQNAVGLAFLDLTERLEKRAPVADEDFPPSLYSPIAFGDHAAPKRHLFKAGGPMVVSGDSAEVLRAHDLGTSRLLPVSLQFPDQTTPVEGEWFYLVVGDVRPGLRGAASTGLHKFDGVDLFMPLGKAHLADNDVVFGPEAQGGPDIWFDPTLLDAPILSDGLMRALKAAKLVKHWDLVRCRVEVS